jgi:hypothetical protein
MRAAVVVVVVVQSKRCRFDVVVRIGNVVKAGARTRTLLLLNVQFGSPEPHAKLYFIMRTAS